MSRWSLAVFVALVSAAVSPSLPLVYAQSRPAEQQAQQGNPSTKVWVNTRSSVYHCPGTRYYGNTKNGAYMTQAEAQKAGNRPAYGKYCR